MNSKNSNFKKPSESILNQKLKLFLYFTVACVGAAILIIEILGAKLLAPYFGTSHFVWTAQITMTLLALASGYAIGGKFADRWPDPRGIFMAIAVVCVWLAIVALTIEPVAYFFIQLGLPIGSLLTSFLLFFLPLGALATIGPYTIRLLTNNISYVGSVAGRLSALSTLGSVGGAILVGYVLIPLFGNITILIGTALFLAILITIFFALFRPKEIGLGLSTLIVCFLLGLIASLYQPLKPTSHLREVYRQNSNFGLLQVIDNGQLRYYLNDLLIQNTWLIDLQKSGSMFTYMLHGLGRAYVPDADEILCIGLGIGVVPREFAKENAKVDVVEINPAAAKIAEKFFGFNPKSVQLYFMDARAYLHLYTNRYDIIVLDAFVGDSSPSHLMTKEAFESMKKRLYPNGVLVINAFGELIPGKDFLATSIFYTLSNVFPFVRLYTNNNGNLYFVASPDPEAHIKKPFDWTEAPAKVRYQLEAASQPVTPPASTRAIILTDNFNPIEYYDAKNRMEYRRLLALSFKPNYDPLNNSDI